MFEMVARSATVSDGETRSVELDELPDDAVFAQQLGDGENEIGGRRPFGEASFEPDADDGRTSIAIGSPSIPASASMPPTPQPSDAESADHRRVRVGAEKGVGVSEWRWRRRS